MTGSMNYECRIAEGWVVGRARYASTEPHHGPGMCYQSMHCAKRERLLSLIIDGVFDTEDGTEIATGTLAAEIWMVVRFPAITDDPDIDYDDDAATFWMQRMDGGVIDEIQLHPSNTTFSIYTDGWDHVERDGDEWATTHYTATIERDAK